MNIQESLGDLDYLVWSVTKFFPVSETKKQKPSLCFSFSVMHSVWKRAWWTSGSLFLTVESIMAYVRKWKLVFECSISINRKTMRLMWWNYCIQNLYVRHFISNNSFLIICLKLFDCSKRNTLVKLWNSVFHTKGWNFLLKGVIVFMQNIPFQYVKCSASGSSHLRYSVMIAQY